MIAQESVPWTANEDLVTKLSSKRPEFNYDESEVPEFVLPDPLRLKDGSKVENRETWASKRRPELMEHFRSQVYGRRPSDAYSIEFQVLAEKQNVFEGRATGREVKAVVSIGSRRFEYAFTVFVPSGLSGEVPAIILINNRHASSIDVAIRDEDPMWPVKRMIDRGYTTAAFFTSDVDPDDKVRYADGVRSFFADGEPPTQESWGSLSAWGWGASRVLDYLQTIDAVDVSKVAVVGHSRGGKTALWAAAEDPRFAVAYSNNSGCGGAALSRRAFGETVARITTTFPHWFCKEFSAYSNREPELPVDQHELIACVAPRAIYVTSADEDLWADPRGEYASLIASAPVFKLLGEQSIEEATMPPINVPRRVGKTGYHIRSGPHDLTMVDWENFFRFFDGVLQ